MGGSWGEGTRKSRETGGRKGNERRWEGGHDCKGGCRNSERGRGNGGNGRWKEERKGREERKIAAYSFLKVGTCESCHSIPYF